MVGHFVGFTGNAAIGVSWQIFLVVMVFVSSLFTGMGVLVARFAGANEPEKVNRVVVPGIPGGRIMSVGVLAPSASDRAKAARCSSMPRRRSAPKRCRT